MLKENLFEIIDDTVQDLPPEKRAIALNLLHETIFMKRTLNRLKDQIIEEGEVEHFVQGSQSFLRESPALKAYNTTVQRFSVMMRQLAELIDRNAAAPDLNNAVYDFLKDY